ncbi:MAG: hypothetical protein NUV54_01310, partial [Candidatus Taylorbacteria bacterium]|nr:hypothetical protein [Candidatus Taylorbacteria bacterium]
PGDNREKQGLVEAIIHDTHFGVPPEFQDFHNWREVDSLEIAGTNGQKVDIFDIMPERYNIFFTDSERQHNGAVHEWYKSIYLMGGDFAAPIRLLTLLHEIGHMWDKKNVDAGRVQPIVEGRHHDLAEQLRQERAAAAFVLKIVRSVTASGDQLREDAVDDAKYHSLESYHSHFRRTIESREHMEAIGKETAKDYSEWTEQEATDCQMWAEFERWQMTDEYLEWKSSEEFRALESWDEYPAWVKWCEDNGTAWWNKTEEPKVEEKTEDPKSDEPKEETK